MIGRWVYSEPMDYGLVETYEAGMDWLNSCESVEDWGCGGGGSKRFCKTKYVGIDGSAGPMTDVIADLREYRSYTPGLFMRHILEHNRDWPAVLSNALGSFTYRMALIMFMDWGPETKCVNISSAGIVLIEFRKDDILDRIRPFLVSESKHGGETVFLLEK